MKGRQVHKESLEDTDKKPRLGKKKKTFYRFIDKRSWSNFSTKLLYLVTSHLINVTKQAQVILG